jgi:acyl-CoA hydrolase
MDHYKLVLPEHLNHYGSLFGGNLLKWIDEFAYIPAKLEFPGHQFVTIALENVEFRQRVGNGEILKFSIVYHHVGNSSVQYNMKAFDSIQLTLKPLYLKPISRLSAWTAISKIFT